MLMFFFSHYFCLGQNIIGFFFAIITSVIRTSERQGLANGAPKDPLESLDP